LICDYDQRNLQLIYTNAIKTTYACVSIPKCRVEDTEVEISGVNDGVRYVFPVLYAVMTRKTIRLYEAVSSKLHITEFK